MDACNLKLYPYVDVEATGRRIKSLIKSSGYTAEEIGNMLGFSKQADYKWTNGKGVPGLETLFALHTIFHTPIEEIVVCKVNEEHDSAW